MKTLPLSLLLIIGLAGSFNAQQSKYEKEQIRKSSIKRVTSVVGMSTKRKFVSDYDQRGNLVLRVEYGSDGSPLSQETYRYDDKDNVVEAVVGGKKRNYIYKYNRGGQVLEAQQLDSEGRLTERTEYITDNTGRVVQLTSYRAGGGLVERQVHTYDARIDAVIQTLVYGPSENLTSRITYEYEGDRLRRKSTYGPSGNLLRHNIYKRDERGLVVEELQVNEKGEPLDRTIFAYEFYS